jgi:hypothetical protein
MTLEELKAAFEAVDELQNELNVADKEVAEVKDEIKKCNDTISTATNAIEKAKATIVEARAALGACEQTRKECEEAREVVYSRLRSALRTFREALHEDATVFGEVNDGLDDGFVEDIWDDFDKIDFTGNVVKDVPSKRISNGVALMQHLRSIGAAAGRIHTKEVIRRSVEAFPGVMFDRRQSLAQIGILQQLGLVNDPVSGCYWEVTPRGSDFLLLRPIRITRWSKIDEVTGVEQFVKFTVGTRGFTVPIDIFRGGSWEWRSHDPKDYGIKSKNWDWAGDDSKWVNTHKEYAIDPPTDDEIRAVMKKLFFYDLLEGK